MSEVGGFYCFLVTLAVGLFGVWGASPVLVIVVAVVLLVCAAGAFVSWALRGTLPRAEVESGQATVRWCVERELAELPPEIDDYDAEAQRREFDPIRHHFYREIAERRVMEQLSLREAKRRSEIIP